MSDKLSQIIPFMPPYKVGYYPGMIYDVPRNQFYFDLLKQCKNKICVDVGFGTGLLTIIALHHGAKHVYAYEMESTSFEFGKQIIENMGLSDRVTLINDRYSSFTSEEIVFSEIIGRSIWNEGIKAVQRQAKGKLLPEIISCNIRCMKATSDVIKSKDSLQDTGLPFDKEYNKTIGSIITSSNYKSYDNVDKNILNGTILNSYKINLNTDIIPDILELDLEIPDDDSIIWCENFINDFRIMNGHWKSDKVVHKLKGGSVKYMQSTKNGSWWLE